MVYVDGFGDLVDVEAPLPKLRMNEDKKTGLELSQYLVVITTFERCAQLYAVQTHRGSSFMQLELMKIRWLRLVVDEGHELGLGT
jgi:hypothetical protein|tara:strand:- start:491 stop:745 length:255 start_codon:yes stop_codon:yes gene_type:complete